MASQGTATSRLAQIQMRFQQKQLQEREQRKMEMTALKVKVPEGLDNEPTTNLRTKSPINKGLNSSIGNGKVRQMFNERRRGAGIDRSNPLKPINSRTSSSSSAITTTMSVTPKTSESTYGRRKEITPLRPINGHKLEKTTIKKQIPLNNDNGNDTVDNSNDENAGLSRKHETFRVDHNDLDSETFPELNDNSDNFELIIPSKIEPLTLDSPTSEYEEKNNNLPIENKSKPNAGIKLNPVLTKKSPPTTVVKSTDKTTATKSHSTVTSQASSPVHTSRKPAPSKAKVAVKTSPKMTKPLANTIASKRLSKDLSSGSHPPGMTPCKICNRFFNEDRISKHEEVCERTSVKQRKIFDASKHRVKGTEAEKYLKKQTRGTKTGSTAAKTSTIKTATTAATDGTKKSNWRIKHEEFIAAIRAAKQVQAHLAKGGKLSDLPPPPRSENPDYIQCPHCSRRFNEAAANRHIPKCANMLHNKPKPANRKR